MLTLQEKCLNFIINNFEEIHCAYLRTEDLLDKLKYEFLKRKFSFELAVKLYESHVLHDYLDFVLNKHLKSLDTDWFRYVPWEDILKKFIEIGPTLEKVSFNSVYQWEDVICHLPNLLHASIYCAKDSHIKMIAQYCPKLQFINITTISPETFSKDGLKPIYIKENSKYPCPDLREIIIGTGNKVLKYHLLDESIGHLISLPFLENLEYSNLPSVLYSLHKDEINVLDKINPYSLTKLQFQSISYSNSGVSYEKAFDDALTICVHLCPNLKTFSCILETESQLEMCSKLSNLEDLQLINDADEPIDLSKFLRLRGSSLLSLKITNFLLCVSQVLNNCSKLTQLHLDNICFQKDKTDAKSHMPKLVDLSFKNLSVVEGETDKAVGSILSASPNLERLSFKTCETELHSPDIKAAIMKSCGMNKLQFISFRESEVHEKFVQDILVTCSSLKTLDLTGYMLSNEEDIDIEYYLTEIFAKNLPNKPTISFDGGSDSDFTEPDIVINDSDDDFFMPYGYGYLNNWGLDIDDDYW